MFFLDIPFFWRSVGFGLFILVVTDQGAQYLLQFLKSRLGKLPVPHVGQRLDEAFVRMRRTTGAELITWCNQLREAYRKLQRALSKTRPTMKSCGVQTDKLVSTSVMSGVGASPSSSPARRQSQSTSEPLQEPGQTAAAEQTTGAQEEALGEEEEQYGEQSPARSDWWNYQSEWYDWQDWQSSARGWTWKEDDIEDSFAWEDVDTALPDILPEEVLGWLLLRRSGLSSSSKLSVLAAAGNSLRFSEIERAMRQQEDELLHAERQRSVPGTHKHQRSFWVEQEGQWGLLMDEPDDYEAMPEEAVHWVDNEVMANVIGLSADEPFEYETAWVSDGYYDWSWYENEWQTPTSDGWIAHSDLKPWMDIDEINAVDQGVGKELHDLYIAFDQKHSRVRVEASIL